MSILFIIRGNKNQNHYDHFSPTKMAIKNTDNNKYCQECEETGTCIHCWREYKMVQLHRKSLAVPLKVKHRVNVWPSNSIPKYTPQRNANTVTQKLNTQMYSNIHNSQQIETQISSTEMSSTDEWMKKCGTSIYYTDIYWNIIPL